MSCYSCSDEFGILKKEVGCEVCGFAFCSRCCKKQEIPSDDEKKTKVICNKCFKEMTSDDVGVAARASPPLAHKKRMAALKKQSFSVDSASHITLKAQWSDVKDRELAERLQKLKRDRIKDTLPTEGEIEERLAKLKGMDPSRYKAPPIQVFRPTEKRTSVEQASDLMKQMTEEVDIDSRRAKPEAEIAARLALLKDKAAKKGEEHGISSLACNDDSEAMDIEIEYSMLKQNSRGLAELACRELRELSTNADYKKLLSSMQAEKGSKGSDNDEEEADKLVEKLLATNIDEDMDDFDSLNDQESEKPQAKNKVPSEEEFPWCVICTEDARMRCFGCDEDLYCIRCFKECHDSLDIKDHRTCPFLPPKTPVL